MNNRAGFWRKNLSGELEYKSFVPSPLPPNPVQVGKTAIYAYVKYLEILKKDM